MTGPRDRRPPGWFLLAIAYALLLVAWALADPPFATPDEPTNLIRAAAVGRGELDGPRVSPFVAGPDLTALQAAFANRQTRGFAIPAGLVPPPVICFALLPDTTADCLRPQPPTDPARLVDAYSYVGTYPPLAYVAPGLVIRLTTDLLLADYLGRLAVVLVCALLLGAAARLVWRASPTAPAGLVLAVTPMVLFHAAGVAASGVEISAAICFAAALLAVTRDDPPRSTSAALAVSGAVLALTRPLGPLYVAALVLPVLPLIRVRTLRSRPVLLAGLAVGAAVALGMVWSLLHQQPHQLGVAPVLDGLWQIVNQSPDVEFEVVGLFGWDDTYLPLWLYNPWWLLLLALVVAGLAAGAWRERVALLLAVASTALVTAAVYGLAESPAWWRIEGRWVLPVLAMVPLLATHALRRAGRLARVTPLAVAAFVAALQFLALWYNEHRYAVGRDGPFLFFSGAHWSPPSGWLLPFTLAGAGALLIVGAFAIRTRRSLDTPPAFVRR